MTEAPAELVVVTAAELLALRPKLSAEEAEAMVTGTVARAVIIAPCITRPGFPHADAAKGIILDALLRRADAGSGIVVTQTAGAYSQTTDGKSTLNLFTQQEREDLAGLCKQSRTKARTIYTAPGDGPTGPLAGAQINGPLGTGPGGL